MRTSKKVRVRGATSASKVFAGRATVRRILGSLFRRGSRFQSVRGNKIMIRQVLSLVLFLRVCLCATAQEPVPASSAPVTYQHLVRHDPNYSIHIVRIDLK